MSGWTGDRKKKRGREKRLKRGKKEQPKNAAFKNVNSEFISCGSSGSPSSYNSNGLVKMRNCQNGCYFLCLPKPATHSQEGSKALQFLSLLSTHDKWEDFFAGIAVERKRISHIDIHWMFDDAIMRGMKEGKAFWISDHYSITC
jgi:hypothetical protein